MTTSNAILFEPWNLGDAIIAFATALQDPDRIALACSSRWLTILRSAAGPRRLPRLIPIDLGYVTRQKFRQRLEPLPSGTYENTTILSIRGDLRDYRSAKKLFPKAPLRITGWIPFLAHRYSLPDLPFARGWITPRNRYRAWATLSAVDWSKIESRYKSRINPVGSGVLVHVGAQWASKQYPYAAQLVRELQQHAKVLVAAGPGDPLPEGILEDQVCRLADSGLVDAMRSSRFVIANDSGPMHLAAFLGCRTILITHRAAMAEWLPPYVDWVRSTDSPRGYRSGPSYLSDVTADGWPSPGQIVARATEITAA